MTTEDLFVCFWSAWNKLIIYHILMYILRTFFMNIFRDFVDLNDLLFASQIINWIRLILIFHSNQWYNSGFLRVKINLHRMWRILISVICLFIWPTSTGLITCQWKKNGFIWNFGCVMSLEVVIQRTFYMN